MSGTVIARITPILEGDSASTGVERIRAPFNAIGGETSLLLSSLTPSITFNAGSHSLFIKSSTRGDLDIGTDYWVSTATNTVHFTPALIAGEKLEILRTARFGSSAHAEYCMNNVSPGTSLITCDFQFEYFINPTKRHGAIMVFFGGVLLQRNLTNLAGGDGDYYEIDSGTGLSTQIQLNFSANGGENITVFRV
jgi:hypothetical protein